MKTEWLRLLPDGVLIAWKWEWDDGPETQSQSSSTESEDEGDHCNPYMKSDSESDSDSQSHVPSQTHIVTFKCIGTTHDSHAQDTLR